MIAAFLMEEIADCEENGISVTLSPTPTVMSGGLECMGWFDDKSMQLQVAIDRPIGEWLSTFVHESCHKDQFVEKSPAWDTKIGTHDTCEILDMWLERIVELSPEQLAVVIDKVQMVELSCERRSVEKICKWGLPIDVELYTRRANAYVWFYRTLPLTRRWVTAPYNNPALLALMPPHFDNDYRTLPDGFLQIIKEMVAAD
jgi:hypothetical protein